jgi:hypothetical protein
MIRSLRPGHASVRSPAATARVESTDPAAAALPSTVSADTGRFIDGI